MFVFYQPHKRRFFQLSFFHRIRDPRRCKQNGNDRKNQVIVHIGKKPEKV